MMTRLYRLIESPEFDFEIMDSELEKDLYFNNVTINSDGSLCFIENRITDIKYLNSIFSSIGEYCDNGSVYLYLIKDRDFARLVGLYSDKNGYSLINVKLLYDDRDDRELIESLARLSKSDSDEKEIRILNHLNNYLNNVKEDKNKSSILSWILSSLALDAVIVTVMLITFYFIAGNFIDSIDKMVLYPIFVVYGASVLSLLIKIITFTLSKALARRPKEKILKELSNL